jgi:hypothetical protein
VEVVRKSLEVSIREARHAWGRVLFVGLDSCEIVVVGGWLSEDLGEACSTSCNVGYVCYGFPDEIGEVIWDHEVRNVSSKGCTRFDDFGPVRIVIVERSLVMGGAAVVAFEFGRDRLETVDGIC